MCYSKIYIFLACIIFKQNVFNNRLFVYMFRPDVTVMVDRVLKSNHLYICLYLTHFQPSEWLGAQIQSYIYLSVYPTHFLLYEGLGAQIQLFSVYLTHFQPCKWLVCACDSLSALWVAGCSKSNCFLCIRLIFSLVSGWVLKIQSSIYLSVYPTHFQPCEWLGTQIQSSVRLCIRLTFSHVSEWLGAQIQSFSVYLTHFQPCKWLVCACDSFSALWVAGCLNPIIYISVCVSNSLSAMRVAGC